jgi:hypothetical protein
MSAVNSTAVRGLPHHRFFQLLAMIAMEPPISFDADAVRAKNPARMFDAPGRGAHRALTWVSFKLIVAATVGKFDATCLGSKNRTPLTWISVWSRVR